MSTIPRGLAAMQPCDLTQREIMGLCRARDFHAHKSAGFSVRICAQRHPRGDVWYEVNSVAQAMDLLDRLEREENAALRVKILGAGH